jgi:hypothetical protein
MDDHPGFMQEIDGEKSLRLAGGKTHTSECYSRGLVPGTRLLVSVTCKHVCPPLHTRHILHSARYAAASQSTNKIFLLIKLSVALVRNNLCSLKMIELSKHVGTN